MKRLVRQASFRPIQAVACTTFRRCAAPPRKTLREVIVLAVRANQLNNALGDPLDALRDLQLKLAVQVRAYSQ